MKRSIISATVATVVLITLTLLFFWKILLTNLILVGVDTFLYFYPYKAYTAEALQQGRLPLWNPHLFMGAPLLANSQVGVLYLLNWPLIWLDPPKQVAWSIGLHIALAGLLMLAYTRLSLRLSWPGAMVSAIIFAFGGYLGAQVEHINQLNAAAWLPLLFLFYDFSLERPCRWLWILLLALVIALTLLAGHAQTVFISLFGLGLYALFRFTIYDFGFTIKGSTFNVQRLTFNLQRLTHYILPLAVAAILAAALAAVQILPTAELSGLSIRSGGLSFREAVSFSLRPTLLHYTLLPPFGVDLSQLLGQTFGEWVAYLGISGLILALLGAWCALWQPPTRRFVFLAAAGLILSLGLFSGPLYAALYYLIPGFNLFRVPARWLLLYAFSAAILAGYGLNALMVPILTRRRLATTWEWLRARQWRMLLCLGLPLVAFLALIIWKTPPAFTLTAWLGLAIVVIGLIIYDLYSKGYLRFTIYDLRPVPERVFTTRYPPRVPDRVFAIRHSQFTIYLLLLILLAELFLAAQRLNYNHPTAPQAYHSLRNAPAFLLAADPPNNAAPPGRFLSLSGITYDPGDLRELQQIFSDSLSEKALYNLIVAAKEKEVLFYNLPLIYGLHSVDGYDGGILPLKQFITLQKLFLPPDDLSIDGRLREKLRFMPPGRLLSLLNTRWIITDKQFDVWIDDIFYDLQFPARLAANEEAKTRSGDIPDFPATAIGLVSHLEGAADLPGETPVADVTLDFSNGDRQTFTLKAGVDTAEGVFPASAAHPQARIGVAWPYQAGGVDYITLLPLSTPQSPRPSNGQSNLQSPIPNPKSQISSHKITGITVTATLPAGQFVLTGLSLIHQPTKTSRSVLLTTQGDYRQVHSGDVKIYENRAVLPRAFIVHQAQVVSDETAAIATMQNPTFDPAQTLVQLAQPAESPGLISAGQPSPADRAEITRYEPERVEIRAKLASPGWLALTDTDYPGWQVSVNGQPAEIRPTNLMFRAVELPAGESTVVFEYKPRSVQVGAFITVGALAVWLVGLIMAIAKR
jgi:hypothetical protein